MVFTRHADSPVLKDVSLSVASRQKIGIVGRTGRSVVHSFLADAALLCY